MTAPLRNHDTAEVRSSQRDRDHRVDATEVNPLNPVLVILRRAIDDSGWKHAALASVLDVKPQYLSMMLAGEKPWTAKHQQELPDDIEAIFARLYAERFGLIVVVPVEGDQAIKSFVSGLLGLLGSKLPARAGKPLKADLR